MQNNKPSNKQYSVTVNALAGISLGLLTAPPETFLTFVNWNQGCLNQYYSASNWICPSKVSKVSDGRTHYGALEEILEE